MFDWNAYLSECFHSTEYLCLATIDGEQGVWSSPVYFAWDTAFGLYFISLPNSRHMKNIILDGRVAVSIYPTSQSTHGDVIGAQIEGVATILKDREAIKNAYATYFGRVYPEKGKSDDKTPDDFMQQDSWRFVKITPKNVWYFDTRFFDEEKQGRQLVPRELYS